MMQKRTTWILFPLLAVLLVGCKSAAKRAHDEAVKARIIQEQAKLDGVEQRRSDYSGALSCRHVTGASLEQNAITIDKNHCSPEQLKLEEDFEKQEQQEKLAKSASEVLDRTRKMMDKLQQSGMTGK
jgi:hypothetical protein